MSELSPRARALLQQSRGGGPSPEQRRALRDAVLTASAAGVALGVASKSASASAAGVGSATGGVTLLKLVAVGVSLGLAGAGASIAVAPRQADAPVPPPTPRAHATLDTLAPAPPPPLEEPLVTSEDPAAVGAEPGPTEPPPPSAVTRPSPRAPAPAPKAVAPPPLTAPSLEDAQEPTADAKAPGHTPAASLPPPEAAPTSRAGIPAASLQQQLWDLSGIATALDEGRAADARDDAERYRRRYPSGALLPEVALLEVLANCALGEVETARALAQSLSREALESPAGRRLKGTCADPAAR